VWHRQWRADPIEQWMSGQDRVLVYAASLLGQSLPFDSVHLQDRTVCRETRPDARNRVLPGEAEQFHEVLPVRLLGEHRGAGLGSRHDQGIEWRGEQFLERPVAAT